MSRATTQKTDQSKTTVAASGPPAGQSVMCAERHLAAETWLLAAALCMTQIRWQWREGSATFLRCGGLFTALGAPTAAVIANHGATLFSFLMPAGTGRRPALAPKVGHLAARSLLGVPPLRATCPRGVESCGPVPMTGNAELRHVGLVARLVQRGHRNPGGGEDR